MKDMKELSRTVITAAILTIVTAGSARVAGGQHVTAATASMRAQGPEAAGWCEERARQATKMLDVLNANLERARQTNNPAKMRAAVDALQKGFLELKGRLDACRAGATFPGSPSLSQAPAASTGGAMDHAAMDHAAPAGGAAAPTTVRQISGLAEAALQSFQDALQIGNREVALQWLAPDATILEAGVTYGSRDAYANEHMGVDMAFLKTGKVVLLDRQVRTGGDSTHIVSTSRITARAGETPVDIMVSEEASLKRTPHGWRIVSIEWSAAPGRKEG